MTNNPVCVYARCDADAKVVRKLQTSGAELTYCRDHDPLREDSDVQWAFTER